MNINEKYNLKIKYDQFGNLVSENFYDHSEEKLILEFEKNCLELKEQNKQKYFMLELGSNQAYYSCLFKKILTPEKTINIMLEPVDYAMRRGKTNFELNEFDGFFIQKSIGNKWGIDGNLFPGRLPQNSFNVEQTTIDEIMKQFNIDFFDVLHCDIDESELYMLELNKEIFEKQVIEHIYILTHDRPNVSLHEECKKFLRKCNYNLVYELNRYENPVGNDGLIVFKK